MHNLNYRIQLIDRIAKLEKLAESWKAGNKRRFQESNSCPPTSNDIDDPASAKEIEDVKELIEEFLEKLRPEKEKFCYMCAPEVWHNISTC